MSRRWILPLAGVLGATVAVLAFMLSRPVGLPSRSVGSVPELLSEPAGIPGAGLTLAADGLGVVDFGADEADAMAILNDLLGTPVEDAPQPCQSKADTVRYVRWGDLSAAFPGGRFGGWIIGVYVPPDSPPLQVETEAGVALDAPVADLLAAYGDHLAWTGQEDTGFPEPIDGFGIDGYSPDSPSATGIGGYVEGGREEGRIITFIAGQPCGPPAR